MSEEKILPFDYIKGHEFTETLKEVTGCKTFLEMAALFDVPKATFSTWNLHNRTSHELIVRLHLAKGIPIRKLALGEEDSVEYPIESSLPSSGGLVIRENSAEFGYGHHSTVLLNSYCLANGQLIETGEIPYPVRRMNSFNLNAENIIEVETNEAIYLVDKSSTDAVSGVYLIDVDGLLSFNRIQRFPGKKLAIAFGESTIEAKPEDIKVIGRVAVTSKKD
ncbi:phage repressor protein CI [Photobacterium halotolerans]|uniref:Chromosome partitioning protein ParA n=1 Tax=Photobacterium halotolerans TaxID=265726 RepID=A0A0F5VH12_9GAMM|nr:phage repressor protein CI [Photobacterium halotolerans]KKD01409.1 chromosome partitioning protein ParA [Photobacterium halotolerans]